MTPATEDERPNLLVVCVDCLREDHVAEPVADTPFLDSLAERGLTATELFASTTTTSPSVASLLTGTYSERNGIRSLDVGRLSSDVPTFAECFGSAGYHTSALVTGPLVEETGLARGFDTYRYREPERSLFTDWAGDVRSYLADLPEPFAAYLHLWELHEDVTVPHAFDDPAYGSRPYARALSALDRELETLYESLPEGTIVAVHGDHGESITHRSSLLRLSLKSIRDALRYYGGLDTRRLVRRLNNRLTDRTDVPDHYIENGHGENVFDFVTNVPFILEGPGIEPATIEAQTRQVDVLPTLLSACGVEAEDGVTFEGASFLEPEAVTDRPAYMRACGDSLHRRKNWARAIRADGAKYVEYPDRSWSAELYDLETDPLELAPVTDEDREAALKSHLPSSELEGGEHLDIEERLEALGYR